MYRKKDNGSSSDRKKDNGSSNHIPENKTYGDTQYYQQMVTDVKGKYQKLNMRLLQKLKKFETKEEEKYNDRHKSIRDEFIELGKKGYSKEVYNEHLKVYKKLQDLEEDIGKLDNSKKTGEYPDLNKHTERIDGIVYTKDAALKKLKNDANKVKSKINELNQKIADKDKIIIEHRETIDKMKVTIEDLENAHKEILRNLDGKQTENTELTEQVKNLTNTLENIERVLEKNQKTINSLEAEIAQLKERNTLMKRENEQFKQKEYKIAQMEQKNILLEKEISKIAEDIVKARDKMRSITYKNSDLKLITILDKENIQDKKENLEYIISSIDNLEKERSDMIEKNEKMQIDIEEKKSKIEQLTIENKVNENKNLKIYLSNKMEIDRLTRKNHEIETSLEEDNKNLEEMQNRYECVYKEKESQLVQYKKLESALSIEDLQKQKEGLITKNSEIDNELKWMEGREEKIDNFDKDVNDLLQKDETVLNLASKIQKIKTVISNMSKSVEKNKEVKKSETIRNWKEEIGNLQKKYEELDRSMQKSTEKTDIYNRAKAEISENGQLEIEIENLLNNSKAIEIEEEIKNTTEGNISKYIDNRRGNIEKNVEPAMLTQAIEDLADFNKYVTRAKETTYQTNKSELEKNLRDYAQPGGNNNQLKGKIIDNIKSIKDFRDLYNQYIYQVGELNNQFNKYNHKEINVLLKEVKKYFIENSGIEDIKNNKIPKIKEQRINNIRVIDELNEKIKSIGEITENIDLMKKKKNSLFKSIEENQQLLQELGNKRDQLNKTIQQGQKGNKSILEEIDRLGLKNQELENSALSWGTE